MDINTLRSIVTVITFLVFIGIVVWAWSSRNAKSFDEAAQLPFKQDEDSAKELDKEEKNERFHQ